jgi:hypothetical protein
MSAHQGRLKVTHYPGASIDLRGTDETCSPARPTMTIAAETLGTVTARSTGTFQRSFTVPCTFPAGEHTITATAPSGQRASTSVTLRSCAEPTPARVQPNFTG